MLNECHVFTEDITALLVDLLQTVGLSKEWVETFISDLKNVKQDPEKDKLEADLDRANVVLDELTASIEEKLIKFDREATGAYEAIEGEIKERQKKELQLLKIQMEELIP